MKRIAIIAIAAAVLGVVYAATPTRTASLSWTAVTQDVEGGAITGVKYNVYRGLNGAAKTRIQSGLTALTFTDTGLPSASTACYQVTAETTIEGAPSTEGCKSFPAVAPGTPTLTVN